MSNAVDDDIVSLARRLAKPGGVPEIFSLYDEQLVNALRADDLQARLIATGFFPKGDILGSYARNLALTKARQSNHSPMRDRI